METRTCSSTVFNNSRRWLLTPVRRTPFQWVLPLLIGCAAMSATPGSADEHWSLQPLTAPAIPAPAVSGWARTPVDLFILAKLDENALAPAPEADKATLLRRVYIDLIGLPPAPQELEAFLADDDPEAYERVVDRLLASPHYGERWARRWMDIVHFAETHGHDQDRIRTNAWPYRDYLIASFNQDKPYDQFVLEQLAGDVLFPGDPQATVALGFIAAGPWDESSLRDIREDTLDRQIGRYIDRDDMITTTMATFTSTTVHCARCHDHKFDPITQEDYYSLQAVFAGVDRADRVYDPDPEVHRKRQGLLRQKRAIERRDPGILMALLREPIQSEVSHWAQGEAARAIHPAITAKPPEAWTVADRLRLAETYLRQRIDLELRALPPPSLVYAGASDFAPDGGLVPAKAPRPIHVLRRGEITQPGEEVGPGTLSCIDWLPSRFEIEDPLDEGARRAALARWITCKDNPLTWRSIVNRIWQYHFGRGLVETPNDFGRMGARPTHPELLDWLAATFRDSGGSFKKLDRLLVLSSVYRQSCRNNPAFARIDADNRLLWRMNRSRLDAESVRDSILRISGGLNPAMGGPSFKNFGLKPGIHVTPKVDYSEVSLDHPEVKRRSVYRFLFRTLPDPFMDALDCPEGSQFTPVRSTSLTPLQALVLLNDPFLVRQSELFADRLRRESEDPRRQVALGCELCWARKPSDQELSEFVAFVREHGLENFCRVLFNSNEFIFVN